MVYWRVPTAYSTASVQQQYAIDAHQYGNQPPRHRADALTKTCHAGLDADADQFLRLWAHETERVYGDRMINETDVERFQDIVAKQYKAFLGDLDQEICREVGGAREDGGGEFPYAAELSDAERAAHLELRSLPPAERCDSWRKQSHAPQEIGCHEASAILRAVRASRRPDLSE